LSGGEVRIREAVAMLERLEARGEAGDGEPAGRVRLLACTARNNLALCLKAKGSYEEAEELYLTVIQARVDTLGPAHEDTIVALHNLAELYRAVCAATACLHAY
jgi:tetratricopeptide (TPR) repeat protein